MTNTGTTYEKRVFDYICQQVKNGALGIDPNLAKVYCKKGYWSARRNSDIITDVSIEVFRPGAITPWLLWVIECKDLGTHVPVDDVEEFHSKLQQVNAHKGTMVSRNGFSAGVLAYAQSAGIGLIRLTSTARPVLLLEDAAPLDITVALTHAPDQRLDSRFYGQTAGGTLTRSFQAFSRSELVPFLPADGQQ